jgi:hypothetical protein
LAKPKSILGLGDAQYVQTTIAHPQANGPAAVAHPREWLNEKLN